MESKIRMSLIQTNITNILLMNYELVCTDDKFIKSFKSYLREDAVYNFVNSMVEESMGYSYVMKKYFNKDL